MNQDWERWGRDIRNIVQNAIDSQDFRRLNDTIANTVNDAVFQFKESVRQTGEGFRQSGADFEKSGPDFRWDGQEYSRPDTKPLTLFAGNKGVKAAGIILTILGCLLLILGSLVLAATVITVAVTGAFPWLGGLLIGMLLLLVAAGAVLIWNGRTRLGRNRRFHKYIEIMQGRVYCNVKELADKSGRSAKGVVKDLKQMIEKRWFLQGHLDDQETCLMVTDAFYEEYQQLKRQREAHMQAEKERREAREQERQRQERTPEKPETEAEKVISLGNWYVKKIRECNDAIPGVEISRKIDRIELLVRRIFDRVREDPSAVEDIEKMMEYYLPTTVKLLEAYEQLDGQPEAGENIRQAKEEIEKTLDTLNTAFEKLLDSLFEDVAWDISSDISVLEAMLAQEGLTEDGLQKNRK